MILVAGLHDEGPLARVIEELSERGAPFLVADQRSWSRASMHLVARNGCLLGHLKVGPRKLDIQEVGAIYARPYDVPTNGAGWASDIQAGMSLLLDLSPALVINRPRAMSSNASKPFQSQLIARAGFDVPETIVTNDPARVREFIRRHGRVIFKSTSGIRSIVRTLEATDEAALDRIRVCPTQFQAFVGGRNVRVHVVGDRAFATQAITEAVDYRYAARDGVECDLEPAEIEPELQRRCVELVRNLGLVFGGIDLKVAEDGRVFCFEVNPSPGFSFYERVTGQPIAGAVADLLIAADRSSPRHRQSVSEGEAFWV